MSNLFRPTFSFIAGLLFLVFILLLGVKNLISDEGNSVLGIISVFIITAGIAMKVYLRRRT
ncbi:hypothetical protein I5M27_17605 [Adhaeribacter sp. BT258]|uniref:Uncharacterized protein n=1 Tax=Adhaeribacter terrigena TaxID=2793070 RepID=A0ABS1C6M1_9BACT|nr:hypothetical protein [Adhaeribacter terrigena]MBK0404812.1 hypothetical protein [Adhaeribacter terrigena]